MSSSQREIITINIGQCGINLGQTVWEQYCAEYNMDKFGNNKWEKQGPTKQLSRYYIPKNNEKYNNSVECFFEEISDGKYKPRNIMIDSEPNVIDDILISEYSSLYDKNFLLSGNEDAANIFARGHYAIGNEMIDKINNQIRKLVDHCNNLQGFIINHSVGGGTGSGLGTLILESIALNYQKKAKIGFEVYPSPTYSTCVVEPYNALLTTHWLIDHTDISIVLDNEGLYEVCQNWLDIKRPSYDNINRLISKTVSGITTPFRFDECESDIVNHIDLQEFQTNMVPFPRLHFMITSLAPLVTRRKAVTSRCYEQVITEDCFRSSYFFTKIADFDSEKDKYLAISVNYRGYVTPKDANASIEWLKTNKKVSLVEWCPTGFKIGLNQHIAASHDKDDVPVSRASVVMTGNNTAISRVFSERICKKYDLMYSQRSYVHWFVGQGMEENIFVEAREDLGYLEMDYLDVLSDEINNNQEKR